MESKGAWYNVSPRRKGDFVCQGKVICRSKLVPLPADHNKNLPQADLLAKK